MSDQSGPQDQRETQESREIQSQRDPQDIIRSQIEFQQKMEIRQEKLDAVHRKSFVLRKHLQQESGDELEILNRLRKLKKMEQEQIILNQRYILTKEYWYIYMNFMDADEFFYNFFTVNMMQELQRYPLDSLKTRVQAKNRFQDVCHFSKNKVDQLGMYPGLTHRMIMILVGDFTRNLTMKIKDTLMIENKTFQNMNLLSRQLSYSFLQEGLVSALFLPIEIRKMQLQMGQRKLQVKNIGTNYMHLLLPVIFRDSIFYFLNTIGYNLLRYQSLYLRALFSNQDFIPPNVLYSDRNDRYSSMVGSLIFALIVTNPIDVVVSKMATQKDIVYTNPIQCFKLVRSQESWTKLLFSGISSRLGFYLIKGTIFFSYMGQVQDLARSAFEQ